MLNLPSNVPDWHVIFSVIAQSQVEKVGQHECDDRHCQTINDGQYFVDAR